MLTKKFFLICLVTLFSPLALASNYFGGGFGIANYSSDTLDKYDVSSTGTTYGGFFGFRQQTLGLEGFFYKTNANGDIVHNSTEYTLNTEDTLFGAAIRFHVNFLNFKVGYALHHVKQAFKKDENEVTPTSSMKIIYDVQDETRKSDGLVLGAGLRLPFTKTFSIYSDFTHYKLSNMNAAIMTLEAGMRFDVPDLFAMIDK